MPPQGVSYVDIATLRRSSALPLAFLRGCGLVLRKKEVAVVLVEILPAAESLLHVCPHEPGPDHAIDLDGGHLARVLLGGY